MINRYRIPNLLAWSMALVMIFGMNNWTNAQDTWIDLDFTEFSSGAYGNYTETITVDGEASDIILTDVNKNPTGTGSGISSTGFFQFRNTVPSIIEFPEVPNVSTIRMVFEAFGSGRSNRLEVWNSDTSEWDVVQTNSSIGTTGVEFIVTVNVDEPRRYRITGASHAQKIHDFTINQFTEDPILTTSVSSLSNLNYEVENGPSNEKTFTVEGTNLTENIVITPPANFEISETSGSGFSTDPITLTETDGEVVETTIYVRLEASLGIGEYSGNIAIVSDETDDTISLSGTVSPIYDFVEGFDDFPESSASYNSGSFNGVAGNTWNYVNARGSSTIDDGSPGLQNNTSASLNSIISGGIEILSFDYMQMFGTNVNLEVYIGGDLVTTVTSNDETGVVKNSGLIEVNYIGEFEIEFKQGTGPTGGQVAIDNFSWVSFEGGEVEISGNSGWRMLSLPVDNVAVSALAGQNLIQGISGANAFYDDTEEYETEIGANFFTYLSGTDWASPADFSSTLSSGTGFIWYIYDNDINASNALPFTLSASGVSPSDDVTVTRNTDDDVTLIGNPYSGAINVENISTWSGSDGLEAAAQSWNPALNDGEGAYEILTSADAFTAFWAIENTTGTPEADITIPVTSLTGSSAPVEMSAIALSLRAENSEKVLSDENSKVIFRDDARHEWDVFDASKLKPLRNEYATIGFLGDRNGEERIKAIDSRPASFEGTIDIPLALNVNNFGGAFTISAEMLDLPSDWEVVLIDHENGTSTNLRSDVYNFTYGDISMTSSKESNTLSQPSLMSAKDSDTRFTLSISSSEATSVTEDGELPSKITLSQNYPNPFNPTTMIRFALPQSEFVTLRVYDTVGRQVATLVNGQTAAGMHQVTFDATNLSSGVYIYQLQAGSQILNSKMILVK